MKHIILIGMMGAGKSAVGRYLQEQTKRVLYDTDQVIEEREGTTISEIFMAKGEAYFRRTETGVIAEVVKLPPSIIATGGGAFMNPVSRELMQSTGKVYYLHARAETLAERVQAGDKRPLLNTVNVLETITRLLVEREEWYLKANVVVDTEDRTVEQIGRRILQEFDEPY